MSKPPRCLRTIDQGTTQAPTSFAQVDPSAVGVKDALPMEFLNLPMQQETALDEIQHEVGVEQVFMTINIDDSKIRFRKSLHQWEISSNQITPPARNSHDDQAVRLRLRSRVHACQPGIADDEPKACDSSEVASHGSLGIVDLGATKTVIGSKLVPELLNNLGSPGPKTGHTLPLRCHFSIWKPWCLAEPAGISCANSWTPAGNRSSARKYTVSPFKHLAACHRSNC